MEKSLNGIGCNIKVLLIILFLCTASLVADETTIISGFITDSESGENIYGANIFLKGTDYGNVSNLEGYYVLSGIPSGKYILMITYIGYETYEEPVILTAAGSVLRNISLKPEVLEGELIQVTGERTTFERKIKISQLSLNPRQIAAVPRVGEVDLFRALQQLPGVNAEADFSAGLIVRGGDSDQNLILLDGITVYNPSHLMGMFSNFITDGLRDAELLRGGYPAEYGGRLSSVLNVRTKDGNQKEFQMMGEISMVSSKILAEGPIHKGAWLVTARRTYVDKMLDAFRRLGLTDFDLPYYFYDVQANIFQNISEKDRLSISAYFGDDVLDWPAANTYFSWGNNTLSARLRHIFSQRLFSNFMIAHSRFSIISEFGGDDAIYEEDIIDDQTVKGDLTYYSRDQEIKFGFELKNLDISYRSWFGDEEQFRLQQRPFSAGLYGQINWHPKNWVMITGLRLNYYDVIERKFHLAPRFSIKRLLGEWSSLTLSVNRYYQHLFTFNDEFFMRIMNVWISQDTTIATPYADEVIVGYSTMFKGGYKASFETYYKRSYNLYVFKNDMASFDQEIIDPRASDFFEPTRAQAFGLEFFVQRPFGRINGMVSYTLAWVVKQIAEEPRYWANWDRRHNIKLVLNWHLNRKWELGFTTNAYTGVPYTPILGFFSFYETGYPNPYYLEIPGARNSKRLPFYQRVDLGLTRHFKIRKRKVDLYFNVINLTKHKNIFRITYDTSPLLSGEPAEENSIEMFPLIPIIGIRVEF